jgi:hypothetical protein
MVSPDNPYSLFDVDEDVHLHQLAGGFAVQFYDEGRACTPRDADSAIISNSMSKLVEFGIGDKRFPWADLKKFILGMEIAWEQGRKDMQADFKLLLDIKEPRR